MYSTSDLDSAARSSHNESGENAADAYMDKFAKVIELMTGDPANGDYDSSFVEWHDAFGDMLHAAVFETRNSNPLDLDRMIRWIDPSADMPLASVSIMHDFGGIVRHFDPTTGKIDPTFEPRFAIQPEHWTDNVVVDGVIAGDKDLPIWGVKIDGERVKTSLRNYEQARKQAHKIAQGFESWDGIKIFKSDSES